MTEAVAWARSSTKLQAANGSWRVQLISNFHENKVVEPKVDRTEMDGGPSHAVVGVILGNFKEGRRSISKNLGIQGV